MAQPNGNRGRAIAAVAALTLTMVNTTIAETDATISDDRPEPFFKSRGQAIELSEMSPNTDAGKNGQSQEGLSGAIGTSGAVSGYSDAVAGSGAGEAGVIRAHDAIVTFTTVVDATSTVPGDARSRSQADAEHIIVERRHLGNSLSDYAQTGQPLEIEGDTELSHSIITSVDATSCSDVVSTGWNVIDDGVTCFTNTDARGDIVFPNPPGRSVAPTASMNDIIASHADGTSYRLVSYAPIDVEGTPDDAVERGFTGDRCRAPGTDIVVSFDARGTERTPRCDSGAHELRTVFTEMRGLTRYGSYVDRLLEGGEERPPTEQQLTFHAWDPTGALESVPLEITVTPDFNGDIIDGDGLVAPGRTIRTVVPVNTSGLPQTTTFALDPTAEGHGGSYVTASFDIPGYDVVSPRPTITEYLPTLHQPFLRVVGDAAAQDVPRCVADHPVVFEARPDGNSKVPSRTAVLTPTGPTSVSSGGGTATPGASDVSWTLSPIIDDNQVETAIVTVDAGDYAVGESFTPTASYPPSTSGPESFSYPDAIRRVVADPSLDVTFTGVDAIEPGDVGVPVTATVSNTNPDSCADISDVVLTVETDNGTFDLDVGDLGGGTSADLLFTYDAPADPTLVQWTSTVGFTTGTGNPDPAVFVDDVVVAVTPPVPTVSRAVGQNDPTNDTSVEFHVAFDKVVDGFESADVVVGGSSGATTAEVTGADDTFTISVTGMTQSGDVEVSIPAGAANSRDTLDPSDPSNLASVEYDLTGPIGVLSRLSDAVTAIEPVTFRAVYPDDTDCGTPPTSSFVIGGTTGGTVVRVIDQSTGSQRIYDILTGGHTSSGTVTMSAQVDEICVDELFNPSQTVDSLTDPPTVTYQTSPGAPTDVVAVAPRTHFDLTWEAPLDDGGLPITGYRIESSVAPSVWVEEIADTGSADRAAQINGLSPGIPVEFRVSAINEVDGGRVGPASDPSDPVTPNERPRVEVDVAPGTAEPSNAPMIVFVVQFDQPVSTLTGDMFIIEGMSGAETGVITEVSPFDGTTYELAISDYTGSGPLEVRLPEDVVTNATGQKNFPSNSPAIDIDISRPIAYVDLDIGQAAQTRSGPVRFRVYIDDQFFLTGFDEDDIALTLRNGADSTDLAGTITTLSAGNLFVVTVDAVPEAGFVVLDVADAAAVDPAGNLSVTQVVNNAVLVAGLPTAPRSPSAGAGNEMATVSWLPPQNTGGVPLVGYEVEASTDGLGWSSVGSTDGVTTDLVVDGLTNGEPVRFRIAAVNEFGQGPYSEATDAVTPTTEPTVSLVSAPGQADPTTSAPIRFTATFSEEVTGFTADDVLIGGDAEPSTVDITGSGSTYEIVVSGMTKPGLVGAVVVDAAAVNQNGQASRDSNSSFVAFDASGPIATVDLGPDQSASTTSTPIVFSVTFDEAVTGFDPADISVSGTASVGPAVIAGSGIGYTVTIDTVLAPGTVTLTVADGAVIDSLANPSTTIVLADTVTITDIVGPIIDVPDTIEGETDPGQPTGTIEFEVTASDPGSGVSSIPSGTTGERFVESLLSSAVIGARFGESLPVACDPASGSGFPIGSTTVTCSATDLAGNTSIATFDVRIVDNELPVVAHPGNQTHRLPTQGPGPIDFDPATATDNSGAVTVVCDPAVGDQVAVGTVAVTCSASDPSGNSASLTFDVVVSSTGPSGELPNTGGGGSWWSLAAALVGIGALLMMFGRPRRRTASRSAVGLR